MSDIEDMRARKDAAYEERNKVVAALARLFPSGIARTAIEGWSDDWHQCCYIDLPTGQCSWHFHDSQAYLFDGLPAYTKPWDGHDTEEKYRRLAALRGMKRETTYHAQFVAPGSFIAETWTTPLTSADPKEVIWPLNAYAFSIHARERLWWKGEFRYEGKERQVGPLYYHPDSYTQTLDEIRSNPRATSILIDNMKINDWKQIIWTRWNDWPQPFEPGEMEILKAE